MSGARAKPGLRRSRCSVRCHLLPLNTSLRMNAGVGHSCGGMVYGRNPEKPQSRNWSQTPESRTTDFSKFRNRGERPGSPPDLPPDLSGSPGSPRGERPGSPGSRGSCPTPSLPTGCCDLPAQIWFRSECACSGCGSDPRVDRGESADSELPDRECQAPSIHGCRRGHTGRL